MNAIRSGATNLLTNDDFTNQIGDITLSANEFAIDSVTQEAVAFVETENSGDFSFQPFVPNYNGTATFQYTIFDTENRVFQFKRIGYDIETSASKIFALGLERNFGNRLFIGV